MNLHGLPSVKINHILESSAIPYLKEKQYQHRSDRFTKLVFISLGLALTFLYWYIVYIINRFFHNNDVRIYNNDDDGEGTRVALLNSPKYWLIVGGLIFLGGFLCIKTCFSVGSDGMKNEGDIISRLEHICEEYSPTFHTATKISSQQYQKEGEEPLSSVCDGDVMHTTRVSFHLEVKKNTFFTWIRQGGLSCSERKLTSIKGIQCCIVRFQ